MKIGVNPDDVAADVPAEATARALGRHHRRRVPLRFQGSRLGVS
ncbi:hypothetical protein QJS66_07105 [Kocuria rhizophila]|nr:hypothetical protein QJS66_07105 [Kocuria rhizophila]